MLFTFIQLNIAAECKNIFLNILNLKQSIKKEFWYFWSTPSKIATLGIAYYIFCNKLFETLKIKKRFFNFVKFKYIYQLQKILVYCFQISYRYILINVWFFSDADFMSLTERLYSYLPLEEYELKLFFFQASSDPNSVTLLR